MESILPSKKAVSERDTREGLGKTNRVYNRWLGGLGP